MIYKGSKEQCFIVDRYISDLTLEFMMERQQLRAIFLYEFKLGHRAAEATRNINRAFGEGTANDRTVGRWFQRFRNGDESLEDEEGPRPGGRPSAVANDELEVLADPRTEIRELAIQLNDARILLERLQLRYL